MTDILKPLRFIFTNGTAVVPECPKCGSSATGRYIIAPTNKNLAKTKRIFLKNGEFIKIKLYQSSYGEPNAFCVHCGNSWFSDEISIVYPSKSELSDIKVKKHIKCPLFTNEKELDYQIDLSKAYDNGISYLDYVSEDDEPEEDNTENAVVYYEEKPAETRRKPKKKFIKISEAKKEKNKEKAKKAALFFWDNIIVSSTLGVFKDLIPKGADKEPEKEKKTDNKYNNIEREDDLYNSHG